MLEQVQLDDTPYASLMAEQLSRCGAYADQWRYTGLSDPGVTLLQLMAVLTDLQGYHADSVTEAHLRAYARLLGVVPAAQKCTKVSFTGVPAGALLSGTPITVDRKVFEYACQIEGAYRFIQKETVTDYRVLHVGCEGGVGWLSNYHAQNSKEVRVFRYHERLGAWRPVSTYTAEPKASGLCVRIQGGQPGRYRVVYRAGTPFCAVSDGTAGQRLPLHVTGVLPQAFKLWAEDGGFFTDISCHFQADAIITGNGADFPVPKKGARLWAYQQVRSEGAVTVSRKSRVAGLRGTFDGPFVVQTGAAAETAASALGRFQQSGNAGRLRCVTPEDYREAVCALTGLPKEAVTITRQGYTTYIVLPEDTPMDVSLLQRHLSPRKLINHTVRIQTAQKVPVKIRGSVRLTEDHPLIRARFLQALRCLLRSHCARGESITYAALNRAVAAWDFIQYARLTAEEFNPPEGLFFAVVPEPDTEEVIYA